MPDQLSEIKKTLEKMNGTLSEVGKGGLGAWHRPEEGHALR